MQLRSSLQLYQLAISLNERSRCVKKCPLKSIPLTLGIFNTLRENLSKYTLQLLSVETHHFLKASLDICEFNVRTFPSTRNMFLDSPTSTMRECTHAVRFEIHMLPNSFLYTIFKFNTAFDKNYMRR